MKRILRESALDVGRVYQRRWPVLLFFAIFASVATECARIAGYLTQTGCLVISLVIGLISGFFIASRTPR